MADTPLSPRRLAYLAAVRRQKRRIRIWQVALLEMWLQQHGVGG